MQPMFKIVAMNSEVMTVILIVEFYVHWWSFVSNNQLYNFTLYSLNIIMKIWLIMQYNMNKYPPMIFTILLFHFLSVS